MPNTTRTFQLTIGCAETYDPRATILAQVPHKSRLLSFRQDISEALHLDRRAVYP